MQFRYTCDTAHRQRRELIHIIESAEEITVKEFYQNVKPDPILEKFEDEFCKLTEDSLIQCYKGTRQNGDSAYYFRYSAIEHIFY